MSNVGLFDAELNPLAWSDEDLAPIGAFDAELVASSSGPVAVGMSATGSVSGSFTSASRAAEAMSASGSASGQFGDSDTVRLGMVGAGSVAGALTSAALAAESMSATGGSSGSFTPAGGAPAPAGQPSLTSSGGGGISQVIDEAYIQRLLAEERRAYETRNPRPPPVLEAPRVVQTFALAGMRAAGAAAGALAIAVKAHGAQTATGEAHGEFATSSLAQGDPRALGLVHGEGVATRILTDEAARDERELAVRGAERRASARMDVELAERARGNAAMLTAIAQGHQLELGSFRARMDASEKQAAQRAAISRTAAQVRLSRALGHTYPRKRIPRAVYPKAIELEYGKAMIGLVGAAHSAITPLLRELPALVNGRSDAARRDVGESARARQLIDIARHHLDSAIRTSDVEALAKKFGDRTAVHQRGELGKQVRAALGADVLANDRRLPALIDGFVHENASLINSVPGDVITGIEQLTTRAIAAGTPHPALAEQIQERFDIGERRARTIARDQVGKLYGRITAYRHQDLGITSYRWRTMLDERVREEHADREGQEFDYDDPPDDGNPGEPVLCRCSQEPVFDAILAALDDDEE